MRKAIILVFLALFFLAISHKPTLAQDTVIQTDTPVGVVSTSTQSSAINQQKVNYELPYPGILPDSPFYFLKVFRDAVIKILINNDMTMARFNLMNAEKRMYAAKILVDRNKDEIGMTTFSKSNNYLQETLDAIKLVQSANPKNPDIKPFLHQFDAASRKHLELTRDMTQHIDKEYMQQMTIETKRLSDTERQVFQLLRTAK